MQSEQARRVDMVQKRARHTHKREWFAFRPHRTYTCDKGTGKANKHAGPAQCRRLPGSYGKEGWQHFVLVRHTFSKTAQAKQTGTQGRHHVEESRAYTEKKNGVHVVLLTYRLSMRALAKQTNMHGRHSTEECQAHTEKEQTCSSSLEHILSPRKTD